MNKLIAVLKREYLQSVRRRMFIIMTILFPALMAAAFVLPSLVMVKGLGKKQIVIVDGTGRLQSTVEHPESVPARRRPVAAGDREVEMPLDYVYVSAADPEAAAKPYIHRLGAERKAERVDGVFVVPANAFESNDSPMRYYSRSSADFITQQRLGDMANLAIRRARLQALNIPPAEIEKLTNRAQVEAVQISKSGEAKKGGAENLIFGLLFGFLLTMPSFIYGIEIMRGIIQEKSDRVVEVLVSSMSPRALLSGKIIGVAAVGLTQIGAWLLMLAGLATFFAAAVAATGIDLRQYIRASTFIYFILFFILAYLTNVCVYAIAGAICNSDREAQQLIAPIGVLMMLPLFLLGPIITNADSPMIVGLSMMPMYGPVTMFIRTLVSDPPVTQILTSIGVSLLTVMVFLWATAKIFRIGILSYGKRPTIPELMRWVRVA